MSADDLTLTPIGRVESPLVDAAAAPKQGFEGGPDAWLVLDPGVVEALDGLPLPPELLASQPEA